MRVYGGMPVRQETGDMAMERHDHPSSGSSLAMERQLPVMRLQSSERQVLQDGVQNGILNKHNCS